jgi:hypothetical protein
MAIDVKEPAVRASWQPKEENDPLYRYPKPYPVGRAKGESFFTIARKHKIGAGDLVNYNFHTKNSGEINWYLANYVGCPAPKHGQRYYEFAGATYDPVKNTGVIFIPMHGETTPNALNRFGEKIVENYNNTTNKEPGGLCYETCYNRVKVAARAVGVTIPAWHDTSRFSIIWGTLVAQKGWDDVPDEYKGRGAAGAMAYAGLATLVDQQGVWRGDLEPGAVIQVWKTEAEFENAKNGKSAFGHSFIFLNYIYSGRSRGWQSRTRAIRARSPWGRTTGSLDRRQPLQEAGYAGERALSVRLIDRASASAEPAGEAARRRDG